MKHIKLGVIIFFIFLRGACIGQNKMYDTGKTFSVSALQKDLYYLKTKLEKYHPNLYLYTPKQQLDIIFDSLNSAITKPMTELEFYNLITLLNEKIKDGHTMFLPSDEATAYHNSKGTFFPFTVLATPDSLFIHMNCSADATLNNGSAILSINGISTKEIMSQLLKRQIRDGYNQTYPLWILTTYFKDYYSFTYGHPEEFVLEYNYNGITQTKTINALPRDSVKYFRQLRYSGSEYKKGIAATYIDDLNAAILTIPTFDNNLLKSNYQQNFKKTVQGIFDTIQTKNIQHLIIDIRNNQGGDFANGQFLLSNLLSSPFKYLLSGESTGITDPVKHPYAGKLYVLINGGSFSNSGIVSSLLAAQNRAMFIGEETGGNKNIISGDAGSGVLPNTKINCELSSKKYLIQQSQNDGHGTIPDHIIATGIADIEKDKAKEFTIDLIKAVIKNK